MAAVIRPVGIQHADLGERGIALLAEEVIAAAAQIIEIHRQREPLAHLGQLLVVHVDKALFDRRTHRRLGFHIERLDRLKRGLAALDRIHEVLPDLRKVAFAQIAAQQIDSGGAHGGLFALTDQLHALGSRIGALIELAGQIFRREHGVAARVQLGGHVVHLRLGEYRAHASVHNVRGNVLHIVAVDHAHVLERLHAQERAHIVEQRASLLTERRLLFNKQPVYHYFTSRSARAPMSFRKCTPSNVTPSAAS